MSKVAPNLSKADYELIKGIPLDTNGHIEWQCPKCNLKFGEKIDHTTRFGASYKLQLFCPYCGEVRRIDHFFTPELQGYFSYHAPSLAQKVYSQGNIFGGIALSFLEGTPSKKAIKYKVKTKLRQHKCQHCECVFSINGNAPYCPACGKGSGASMVSPIASVQNIPWPYKTTKNSNPPLLTDIQVENTGGTGFLILKGLSQAFLVIAVIFTGLFLLAFFIS